MDSYISYLMTIAVSHQSFPEALKTKQCSPVQEVIPIHCMTIAEQVKP